MTCPVKRTLPRKEGMMTAFTFNGMIIIVFSLLLFLKLRYSFLRLLLLLFFIRLSIYWMTDEGKVCLSIYLISPSMHAREWSTPSSVNPSSSSNFYCTRLFPKILRCFDSSVDSLLLDSLSWFTSPSLNHRHQHPLLLTLLSLLFIQTNGLDIHKDLHPSIRLTQFVFFFFPDNLIRGCKTITYQITVKILSYFSFSQNSYFSCNHEVSFTRRLVHCSLAVSVSRRCSAFAIDSRSQRYNIDSIIDTWKSCVYCVNRLTGIKAWTSQHRRHSGRHGFSDLSLQVPNAILCFSSSLTLLGITITINGTRFSKANHGSNSSSGSRGIQC